MADQEELPTSSTNSSSYPSLSSTSVSRAKRDLTTGLRIGHFVTASSSHAYSSNARDQVANWPPIKRLLRTALAERGNWRNPATFFVKVHMEGILIGRKLDLYAHNGYGELIRELAQMFKTTIILSPELAQVSSRTAHVLTYKDKEGDWMMAGDVPWEFFLTTINRLKITRADKC